MMLPTERPGGGRDPQRGAALAELTLVVPIMLTLLLVVFDFGQGFLAYISVTDGARDGARVAAQNDLDCIDEEDMEVIKQAALDAADSEVTRTRGVLSVEDPVIKGGMCSVTVNFTYTPILPFVTSSFSLPGIGTVGPLWNGSMSEEMRSQ